MRQCFYHKHYLKGKKIGCYLSKLKLMYCELNSKFIFLPCIICGVVLFLSLQIFYKNSSPSNFWLSTGKNGGSKYIFPSKSNMHIFVWVTAGGPASSLTFKAR